MLHYSVLCLCFLTIFHGSALSSPLTKDELYSRIGNKHMLATKDTTSLINAQKPNIDEEYLARDCRAAYRSGRRQSGLYVIRPKRYPSLVVVYCDMEYDGGGWTVLHRNDVHTALQSNQTTLWSSQWDAYKHGFGDLLGNHWLGNEFMYLLTRQNAFFVRFVITDGNGKTKHADYQSFRVDSEESGYVLRLGNYTGDAGDALTTVGESGIHDNMRFSTQDRDNDRRATTNCALDNGGGWWYDNCYSALLTSSSHIYWKGLCTQVSNCKVASIMIKPNGKNCHLPLRY
ncbi:fibrinogen-like protein 1-like protein [Elgaria multicarinata webbii]|uniref:fibrinogen-like protein 1-like protein n=1 Tax=Elgaria multicarinata webbii TaxID=159646 RepID=UPI002FCD69F1